MSKRRNLDILQTLKKIKGKFREISSCVNKNKRNK